MIAWPILLSFTLYSCQIYQARPARKKPDEAEREAAARLALLYRTPSRSPQPEPAAEAPAPRPQTTAIVEENPIPVPPNERLELLGASRKLLSRLDAGEEPEKLTDEVLALGEKLQGGGLRTMARWTAMRAELLAKNADEEIIKRHDEFRDLFVARSSEATRLLGVAARDRDDPELLQESIGPLVDLLEPPAESKDEADDESPNDEGPEENSKDEEPAPLPYRAAGRSGSARAALTGAAGTESPTRTASRKSLEPGETNGGAVSALIEGGSTQSVTGPPTPEDLAATPDIALDEEIAALAAELWNNPVKIFEFVRNEFAYEPYFGSLKGAKKTIRERAGNDVDLAGALMALFRVSGIPCRYVRGKIELSAGEAAKLVGVDDPGQLAKVFTAGGIPSELDFAGGTVGRIRLDHVWVKAHVDYFPYRGPVPEEGDTWIELDPSFKQNTYTSSRDVEAAVGLNPAGLLNEIKARSAVDPDGSHVTGVPEPYILGEILGYAEPVRGFLISHGLTPETVFRQRMVEEERFGILPVADQYRVAARAHVYSELPPELRHKITISIVEPDGSASLEFTSTLPEAASKRISLSYRPETDADAQVVASYADEVDFPAYLVSLVPELRVGGEVVASGAPVGMGGTQKLAVAFTPPGGTRETVRDDVIAGSYSVLVLDLQRIAAGELDLKRAALDETAGALASDPTGLDREDAIGDVLQGIGLSYFRQADRLGRITAGSLEVTTTRQPSVVRVAWDLTVRQEFGLPFTARADRVTVDVGRDVHAVVALDGGNAAAENRFAFTSALTGSALEHNVLIQSLFDEAVSAVRVLQTANFRGMKTFTVTPENVSAVVPQLDLPQWALDNIEDAVNARREVTVPGSAVAIYGVPYVAYIERDIDTSASDFVLNGSSGGEQPNASLTAADLIKFGDASRYLAPVKLTAGWLKVAEGAVGRAGLSYVAATTAINAWYADRTELDPVTTLAAAIAVSGPLTRDTTSPAILNVTAGPELISPNGDGRSDAFRLRADVTRNAAWTVEFFKNGSDTPIRTVTGTTSHIDVTFDDPDATDNGYTYVISARTEDPLVEAEPASGSFRVDVTAPLAVPDQGDSQGLYGIIGLWAMQRRYREARQGRLPPGVALLSGIQIWNRVRRRD